MFIIVLGVAWKQCLTDAAKGFFEKIDPLTCSSGV